MFRQKAAFLGLGLALLLGAATAAGAADDIRTERVHFKPGASSAVVEGSIKGYAIVDYVVNAREGQQMNASLATKHGATYFNILAPGETEVAMFNGSTSENRYEGTLPKSGDYKLRVYMMRSAARREETANYRLEIAITGGGAHGSAPKGDAKVPGTDFHATGKIPCSMGGGQPTGSCDFGVTREGAGSGMVTVTRPDGRKRVIFFEKGRATGYDKSQADTGEFRASRQGDLTIVQIGSERYEIPDAVIQGG
jgi:hypothetical protein